MKIGIIQSNYIPWRGYFDFINSVDIFILYDCVQYTKRDWRNRNMVKSHSGCHWLSIPVVVKSRDQLISETRIDNSQAWLEKNLRTIFWNYKSAPFFEYYYHEYKYIMESKYEFLSDLNCALLEWLIKLLNIKTTVVKALCIKSDLGRTENLLEIVHQHGGTLYVSGPAAASYLDVGLFAESGIGLEYKSYDYDPYPQLFPPFAGNVSILDLLFNVGPESINFITSKTPNTVVLSPKNIMEGNEHGSHPLNYCTN